METLDSGVKAAFLDRLTKATREGHVRWEASEGRGYWYYVRMTSLSYAIESADVDDAPPYDFHIFRIDEEQTSEIELWRWNQSSYSAINDYLRAMYKAAQSSALGTINLADDMFAELADRDGGASEPSSIDLPNEETPF